jgi:uncharacterized protein
MIVDCHTCIWDRPDRLGRAIHKPSSESNSNGDTTPAPTPLRANAQLHRKASEPVDLSIVVGFKSEFLGAEIPNELVADYVKRSPDRLVGFAGIDPTDPHRAIESMRHASEALRMSGVAMAPMAQNVHPCHTNAKTCYEEAAKLRLPILFHGGVQTSPDSVLHFGHPALLDEIAREHASLKIVIAQMGFPWLNETIALMKKRANVFADISWILAQRWTAYQSLLAAFEHGVIDRILFASGFPYMHAAHCIEALYDINHLVQGTNLPSIPREKLRGIVERDALKLLGIDRPDSRRVTSDIPLIESEE